MFTDISNQTATAVGTWLQSERNLETGNLGLWLDSLKDGLMFKGSKNYQIGEEKDFILVPIDQNVSLKTGIKQIEPFIFQANSYLAVTKKKDKILSINILQIKDKNQNNSATIQMDEIEKTVVSDETQFSGSIVYLSFLKEYLYNKEFSHGLLTSFSKMSQTKKLAQNHRENGNSVALDYPAPCTDWYLETTYYDATGNVIEVDDDYLTTTCPEGSGGGGTPPSQDSVYEADAVKTTPEWRVNPEGESTEIYSIERLRGKQVKSEPGGGHFTSTTHISDYCVSGNVVWGSNEIIPTVTDMHVDVEIKGNWHYETPPKTAHYVDGENSWLFSDVFK